MNMIKNRIKGLTTESRASPQNNRNKEEPVVFQVIGKQELFLVESDDKRITYKVKWNGRKGVCSCPDYQKNHNNNGYTCMHIMAVKNGNGKLSLCTNRSPVPVNGKGLHPLRTDDEIRNILNRDFPEDKVFYRPDGLKTIETAHIIDRLNEAFGPLNWSFAHGKPVDNGNEYACRGRIRVVLNGKDAYREQIGTCRYGKGNNIELSQAEAQTGAIQMALKKCASLFGVGLRQVYSR